jgi:hypothetical protein
MTRPPAPHGTDTAYRRHLRRNEPACEPCRKAGTAAARERREREPVGLTGGAWVLDQARRVLRWEWAS